jgi:serine/threonine protein kinase
MRHTSEGRIGPYEILDLLGSGGMGVVYRAHDRRLGRQVAVKVLLPEVVADTDALVRFEREMRAVAALSHPNILAIYDFQRDGQSVYAVMELLTGGTLRERLRTGPLPPRKAVDIGIQIAKGLAAAHEQGFVHRDLKPENVAFTKDGRVKILDFGLARESLTAAEHGSDSPTRAHQTVAGLILGTVGYMSPEQVRGLDVDHRSDLFAFGALLYEMLTGRRAFDRHTPADTMSAILNDDVRDFSESGVNVPPALDRVVRRCLEKHPGERFHSARDLAFALENATGSGPSIGPALEKVGRWPSLGRAAVLAGAGLIAGVGLTTWLTPPPPEPPSVRQLTFSNLDSAPAASPDERLVAFASNEGDGVSRIWLKDLATGGVSSLSDGPDRLPRFSADGSYVYFLRRESGTDTLFRQPVYGTGPARDLAPDVVEFDLSPDNEQVALVRFRRSAGTGQTVGQWEAALTVARLDATRESETTLLTETDVEFTSPRWSPDGTKLAVVRRETASPYGTAVIIVQVGPPSVTLSTLPQEPDTGWFGTIAWTGDNRNIVITQQREPGSVFVPGALARVALLDTTTGEATTLLTHANMFGLRGSIFSNARVDVLGDDRLLMEDIEISYNLEEFPLVPGVSGRRWVTTSGHSLDRQPAYDPDGDAVVFASNRSNNLDIWMATERGLTQLTNDEASDWDPGFSDDGRTLLWSSDRGGAFKVWTAALDLTGRPTARSAREVPTAGRNEQNPTMSADGWIVFRSTDPTAPGVWKVRPDGTQATLLYPGQQMSVPDVSPDGRHALFIDRDPLNRRATIRVVEIASGRAEPFEIPIAYVIDEWNADIRWGRARWMPDGAAIAFIGQASDGTAAIYRQAFAPGRDTTATRQVVVPSAPGRLAESFDISPDGTRIVVSFGTVTRNILIAEGVPGVLAAHDTDR